MIILRNFQALVSNCLYTGHSDTSKQLSATATALSLMEPFRRDTEWLGDRHYGRAVAQPASVRDTDICLYRSGNTLSYESVHKSYSGSHFQKHAHTRARAQTRTRTHTHHTLTHAHAHTHACTCTRTHTHTYARARGHTRMHTRAHTHTLTHAHTHTHTHTTHSHTHTHTHILKTSCGQFPFPLETRNSQEAPVCVERLD